ncbi:MAG: peptidoglycan recognition protein family protein [Candidatus Zipacnadales bacterium]
MVRPSEHRRRRADLGSCLLCVAAALVVVWSALGSRLGPHWYRWIFRHRPSGIIIHHTASGGYRNGQLLTAAMIDADHAAKGWSITYKGQEYHIGYHYVIRADGVIEPGRPEEARGAHTLGHNNYLGICLVGNFDSVSNPEGHMQPARPTPKQMQALTWLVRELMHKYDLEVTDIYRHADFSQTSCPGDRFPFQEFLDSLTPVPLRQSTVSGGTRP